MLNGIVLPISMTVHTHIIRYVNGAEISICENQCGVFFFVAQKVVMHLVKLDMSQLLHGTRRTTLIHIYRNLTCNRISITTS